MPLKVVNRNLKSAPLVERDFMQKEAAKPQAKPPSVRIGSFFSKTRIFSTLLCFFAAATFNAPHTAIDILLAKVIPNTPNFGHKAILKIIFIVMLIELLIMGLLES